MYSFLGATIVYIIIICFSRILIPFGSAPPPHGRPVDSVEGGLIVPTQVL
jgi:hypothetical protein